LADRVGEGPGCELHAVIRVHDRTALDIALLDRHVERVDDELGVLDRVDRPADDPAAAGVHHGTAVMQKHAPL